jgi:hypothetical protein
MRGITALLSALTLALVAAPPAGADAVADAISKAQSAYAAGNLREAGAQLQAALAGVQAELAERLAGYLPAPPAGWTADEPRGVGATASAEGGHRGLFVSRDYHPPGGSTVAISVASDSPLYASLRMLVTNPTLASMAGQPGMEKATVCGFDAIEDLKGDVGPYEISILAGSRTVISVSSRRTEDIPHVRALAGSIDCQGITGLLE